MSEILSVVMPVYNAEKYLASAIDSVLQQELSEFELICIDDGSTDRSGDILKSYANRDARVRVLERGRQGLVASLNDGLRHAKSQIVARLDADDICLPGRFSAQLAHLSAHPRVWVIGTGRKLVDSAGRPFHIPRLVQGEEAVAREMETNCALCHPTVMMRREPILNLGGYRNVFKHAEDYDLWLRVIEHAKADNLSIFGILHRIHDESVSEKHKIQQRVSAALAQACHAARVGGASDPVEGITEAPDLWSNAMLDELIPAEIEFFRAVLTLFNSQASYEIKSTAAHNVETASPAVKKRNKALYQEALVFAARNHRGLDFFKVRAFAAAARVHPGRFVKTAFGSQRSDYNG